jgi:hypothetical protein
MFQQDLKPIITFFCHKIGYKFEQLVEESPSLARFYELLRDAGQCHIVWAPNGNFITTDGVTFETAVRSPIAATIPFAETKLRLGPTAIRRADPVFRSGAGDSDQP